MSDPDAILALMDANQPAGMIVRTWTGRPYRLPVSPAQFRSLLNFIEEMLAMRGCDNTLDHAQTWARAHGVPWALLSRGLRSLGGFCDCEIGLNTVVDSDDDSP
jgi:hypothetical protein